MIACIVHIVNQFEFTILLLFYAAPRMIDLPKLDVLIVYAALVIACIVNIVNQFEFTVLLLNEQIPLTF